VARAFARLEPYGLVILLALLFLPEGQPPGLVGAALRPVVSTMLDIVPGSDLVRDRFPI
jgi:hypothetical protein